MSLSLCFLLINCQKERISNFNSELLNSKEVKINRDNYKWIHKSLFLETLRYIESNEDIEYDLLVSQLMKVLEEGGIASKDINNVNTDVVEYCKKIASSPKYPADEFSDSVENLLTEILSSSLSNDEKEIIIVFAEVQYACNELITYFSFVSDNGYAKEQLPRTSYSSRDGETRIERQLNACLQYQFDGHTETFIGMASYLAKLPITALVDVVICAEEIIRGYWDHVKLGPTQTIEQQYLSIQNSTKYEGTRII